MKHMFTCKFVEFFILWYRYGFAVDDYGDVYGPSTECLTLLPCHTFQ